MILDLLFVVGVVVIAIVLMYLAKHYLTGVNEAFGEDEHAQAVRPTSPGLPHHRGRK